LQLTEITPGIDLQHDIFDQMEFRPSLADGLTAMGPDLGYKGSG